MQLTAHFELEELEHSDTAMRRGIDNRCPELLRPALLLLCQRTLEPAREALGPIRVTSGYRSLELNELVGGAEGSQHTKAEAADLVPVGVSLRKAFEWFRQNAEFDQLIWEFGRWIHVSNTNRYQPRREVLEAASVHGRAKYFPYAG